MKKPKTETTNTTTMARYYDTQQHAPHSHRKKEKAKISMKSRRGSTLKEYFKISKEEHPHSHVQIIGGGEFRKKGSQVKNWKIRSYYIKEDGILMYFDPITKEPKGVIDIREIAITEGPEENLHHSGCSDFSLEDGVSLILTIFSESRKMEVVFDTVKDAQRFCLLLGHVTTASNLLDFVNHMKWDDIATAIQSRKDPSSHSSQRNESHPPSAVEERNKKRTLTLDEVSGREMTTDEATQLIEASGGIVPVQSDHDEDDDGESEIYVKKKPTITELAAAERAREKESGFVIESSESEEETGNSRQRTLSRHTKNATIIHSGYFYKQGQVRKNWKQRYFELWSTGVLLYKEGKDSVVQRGRIDLKASTITRLEVMMSPSDDNKFSLKNSTQSSGMQRVTALEMRQTNEKRVFLVTFDINSPSRNSSLLEQFEIALRRTSLESTPLMTTTSPAVIHDTSSTISTPRKRSSSTSKLSTRSNSQQSQQQQQPSQQQPIYFLMTSTGKKFTLHEGVQTLVSHLYHHFIHKKPLDSLFCLDLIIGIHQIISEYITVFVREHKDAVLLTGAPVLLYSLFRICTRPGIISIIIFCCFVSFFGVHYSTIPGLPLNEEEEEEREKEREKSDD